MLIDQAKRVTGIWEKHKWGQQEEVAHVQTTTAHHNNTKQQRQQQRWHKFVVSGEQRIFSTPEENQEESHNLLNPKS